LWHRLTRFLDHPILELSNNAAENAIRPVVHNRNYEQSGIRQSSHKLGCKKLASLLCSGKVKAGEVLRDGFSHTPWIHPYFSAKQLAVGWRLTALA
jgi:hypothetical protein